VKRIKFFIDDDAEFPTICATGTEDYFGGAYDWDVDGKLRYLFDAISGMHQVLPPRWALQIADALWHVPLAHPRPDRFQRTLRVTLQAFGLAQRGR